MKVRDFAHRLGLDVLDGNDGLDGEVTGMYVGDLLSWVMSHAGKGSAWVTIHAHVNIVAVALITDLSCIIIAEGVKPDKATLDKAEQEKIPVLATEMTAYEVCWKAHEILQAEGVC